MHVLGGRLVAHQHDGLATLGGRRRVVGREVDAAHGGAGARAEPLGPSGVAGAGELGVQDGVEVVLGDTETASSLEMPRSLGRTMSTAIFSAAAPVRLPTRVCSIQSLPWSMVNSVSHMS